MSGASYFLVPSLGDSGLRGEVDAAFPGRDKSSDGWIGDPSHAARVSDHNPCWRCTGRLTGAVRAIDLDIGPDGSEARSLRDEVLHAVIGDPRTWYAIHAGVIYSRTYGWAPRVYNGNPHTGHVHVSIQGANGISSSLADQLAFDTSPWLQRAAPPTRLPAVYLGRIRRASRFPNREVHPVNVRRVQRALAATVAPGITLDGIYGRNTRAAFARFEASIGYKGAAVDGLPGARSLTRLGAGRFRVEVSS